MQSWAAPSSCAGTKNGHRRRRNLRTGDTLVAISELRKLQKLQEARADGVPVAESPQPEKQSLRKAVDGFLEEVRVNKAKETWQAFKQVGHSSLAMTMKYLAYLRAESESTREKVNATFAGL